MVNGPICLEMLDFLPKRGGANSLVSNTNHQYFLQVCLGMTCIYIIRQQPLFWSINSGQNVGSTANLIYLFYNHNSRKIKHYSYILDVHTGYLVGPEEPDYQ